MKILVLQSELGVLRGGGETFSRNLFAALTNRGHKVFAAFVADWRGTYPITLPPGIEAIPFPGLWSRRFGQSVLTTIGTHLPTNSWIKTGWNRFQESLNWRVLRFHNERFRQRAESYFANKWTNFDVVYVHGNPTLAASVAQHRPTILRLPGPIGVEVVQTMMKIQAVCANGDALKEIRKFLGDKVLELPVGIDGDLFMPGCSSRRHALGWSAQHFVVGYVGRLTHLKGVDLLASAFREVSKVANNARLLIVGGGEEERNLRSILRKEIAKDIVHIESGVNHHYLPAWYHTMDVLVMPSRYENFSNAILEALACGIPFLASDVGGNRVLAEKGFGWLFHPESIASLTTRLHQVKVHCAERTRRGQLGSRCVRENYSWAASAQCLEQIIASCLYVKV